MCVLLAAVGLATLDKARRKLQSFADRDGLALPDHVAQVHEPENLHRECVGREDAHVQRHREYMQVSGRQEGGLRNAAHRTIAGDMTGPDLHAARADLDGRRLDTGGREQRLLAEQGLRVRRDRRWQGLELETNGRRHQDSFVTQGATRSMTMVTEPVPGCTTYSASP